MTLNIAHAEMRPIQPHRRPESVAEIHDERLTPHAIAKRHDGYSAFPFQARRSCGLIFGSPLLPDTVIERRTFGSSEQRLEQ